LAVVAILIATPFALILWLESEAGQRFIERRAYQAAGREITIGDLDIKIGWRPGLRVTGLRITNPDWAKTRHLVDAALIDARFRLLPLLTGRMVVEDLRLSQARVGLEREAQRNTWTFRQKPDEDDAPSRFFVHRINIDRGFLVYRDTTVDVDLEIDVAGDVGAGGAVDLIARGTARGQKARGVARIPGALPTPDTAVAMSAAIAIGELTAAAAGTVRAADVDGIDLDLDISGASLADLKKLIPINLPNTPPYRLQGRFRNPSGAYIFDPFEGRVGDSDLSGSAQYTRGGPRPVLKANLISRLLDLDDLGPLVGAPPKTGAGETSAPRQKQQARQIDTSGKVLPQRGFAFADWNIMDADVRFEGKRIVDAAQVPIENLSAHWILEKGVLRFDPLRFRIAQGQVHADIRLDGNQKPPLGKANISVNGLNLRQLVPTSPRMNEPLGILHGRIDITGRGTSIADLFGTADGRLAFLVNGGSISNLLVELGGLDVAEALRILATKDVQVKLRCAVADLSLKSGVATPQALVIDTTDTIVRGEGSVDFRREQLDLTMYPEPKDMSIFALRSPITVRNSFKDPVVRPKMGPITLRGAAAIALGAINPLLAFLPFIETGPGKDSDCGQLLNQVKQAGVTQKTPPVK
ncbi:MAG TPA: AsmA family protein, partial [Burkholderiales bacterium]|nr:AsmA family protein [Burkholderiales bacterium]